MTRSERLAQATSAFLGQRRGDDVDWYDFGAAAFERAKTSERPILLVIGYSTSAACERLAAECFRDRFVARRIDEHFVPVVVDRYERPDLDEVYLDAALAMNGSGGWPLTVFLTPDGRPFFAGSFVTKLAEGGRPGFLELLDRVIDLWERDRPQLYAQADGVTTFLESRARPQGLRAVSTEWIAAALARLEAKFDPEFGGFGPPPKFPEPSALRLALLFHEATGDQRALEMVTRTLDGVMTGGLFDTERGGFSRYAVERGWRAASREQDLSESLELALVYLEAFRVTKNHEYERVATLTLDGALASMQSPNGGFFASRDESESGATNALYSSVAGAAIAAFARAARITGDERYLAAAERTARVIEASLEQTGGNLPRRLDQTDRGDLAPSERALLLDYGCVIDGLVGLDEATLPRVGPAAAGAVTASTWLALAQQLAEHMLAEFAAEDAASSALSSAPRGTEWLVVDFRRARDGLVSGPNVTAARALYRLGTRLERSAYSSRALGIALAFAGDVRREPRAHTALLGEIARLFGWPESGSDPTLPTELGAERWSGACENASPRGLALGTQRVGLDIPAQRAAVSSAIAGGIVAVDTAPTFALGDAQRLVGEALAELLHQGKVERGSLYLITKVGVLAGPAARLAAVSTSPPLASLVPLRPGTPLEAGAYCLDPRSLRRELATARERLGVDHLDLCVVQQPEHLLEGGASRSEYEEALFRAFSTLEDEVRAGRIGGYGVSTNTAQEDAGSEVRVSIERLVELAKRAGGDAHHLGVIQLPLGVGEQRGLPAARRAKELGLQVHALRPLTILEGGALHRIAPLPSADEAARTLTASSARYRVAALEAEFETTLAARLRIARRIGPDPVLPLSGALGKTLERAESVQQFDLAESTLVSPRIASLLRDLERALSGPNHAEWLQFRERYLRAVGAWLGAVRAEAIQRSATRLAELEPLLPAVKDEEETVSERALRWLLARPEVDLVVVGLRSESHVDAALRVLHSPAG